MKTIQLKTEIPEVTLVEPDIERDAILGVGWLEGGLGRKTLRSMGVADKDNVESTLQLEQARVRDFIEKSDQFNWMIKYGGQVVGSVWVDLESSEEVPAPSVHIMIGEPSVRGKGVGYASVMSVLKYIKSLDYKVVYSRHLVHNNAAKALLSSLQFEALESPYSDLDGLRWQNVHKRL